MYCYQRAANLLPLLVLLTACSEPVIVRQSMNRMVLPESEGSYTMSISGQTAGGYKVEYPGTQLAADLDSGDVEKIATIPGFSATYGVHRDIDLTLLFEAARDDGGSLVSSPTARVKYQLLGSNQLRATQGDWSLAVTASHAYNADSEYSNNINFWSSVFGWDDEPNPDVEVWYEHSEYALIGGYRPLHTVLLYGGTFWGRYTTGMRVDYGGVITRDRAMYEVYGNNIGVAWLPIVDLSFIAELCATRYEWGNYRDTGWSFGLRVEKEFFF